MTNVNLQFSGALTPSDPSTNPVLIVGQLKHLNRLTYSDLKVKLESRVSEEVTCTSSENFSC